MLDLGFLDIGIGIAFVFLSLSLICSAIREGIEGIFKTRSMDLERGLREMLEDPNGEGFTKKLFEHPLIAGLFRGGSYQPGKLVGSSDMNKVEGNKTMPLSARQNLPSYIPPGNFSSAILDLVVRGDAGKPTPYPSPPLTIDSLKAAISVVDDATIKRILQSAIDTAGGQIENVRASLEDWFNGTMERACGWYKRRTQTILLAIGLVVAVLLNVDAITIVKRLSSDQTLTAAVVAQAKQAANTDASQAPIDVGKIKDNLKALGIPMGWEDWWVPAPQSDCKHDSAGTLSDCNELNTWDWIQIVIGWLITGFAVMLGAPFWFDVLSKFMVVRGTSKPEEKGGTSDKQPRTNGGGKPGPQAESEKDPEGYEPHEWNDGKAEEGVL